MTRLVLVSPAGLPYQVELDYVEGHLKGDGKQWGGWRCRYQVAGEPLPRTFYIDGSEKHEPDEQLVQAAVEQHAHDNASGGAR